MSTRDLYLSQIRTVLRGEPIAQVEQAAGQYNDVVMINNTWVFRFPRQREGVDRMIAEARVLDALRGRLPLAIPAPQHRRFDPPVPGLAFLGYRKLPGDPLFLGALEHLPGGKVRAGLANQLAGFLRALHAIPLAELGAAFPDGIAPGETRAGFEQMYADVRARLLPAMRPEARRAVIEHFEAYLDDPALHAYNPALRHGDFGGSNILWDPQRGALTAVLDFGFCAPGDPAMDLASASTLGEGFFQDLLSSYAPDAVRRAALLARARFYRGLFALEEALDGLRLDDAEAYRRGMETYI